MYFSVIFMYQLAQTDRTKLYIIQKFMAKLLLAFGFNALQCSYFVIKFIEFFVPEELVKFNARFSLKRISV